MYGHGCFLQGFGKGRMTVYGTGNVFGTGTELNGQNTFDLVIADLTMPDLTGLELADAIMGLRPDIPVILCTGFADPAKAEEARKIGIAEVIKKPFGVQDFAGTIRRVLDK